MRFNVREARNCQLYDGGLDSVRQTLAGDVYTCEWPGLHDLATRFFFLGDDLD